MSSILFTVTDAVAIITLNRPEKFNAFNRPMALLLQQCLDDAAANTAVRAVYLTGNGKAFVPGRISVNLLLKTRQGLIKYWQNIITPLCAAFVNWKNR